MWTIKKILYFDVRTNQGCLLLHKNKRPYKTRNTELLRDWYKRTYVEAPEGFTGRGGVVSAGRLTAWLDGVKNSQAIEDAVANLKKTEASETEISEDSALVRGWFPTVCPFVEYDLELELCTHNNRKILEMVGMGDAQLWRSKKILWMNINPPCTQNMGPFISYSASKTGAARVNNGLARSALKKSWRKFNWESISALRVLSASCLSDLGLWWQCPPLCATSGNILLNILRSGMDPTLFVCLFSPQRWMEKATPADRNLKWNRLTAYPESILLQGEDYMWQATIDDYKRLLLFIGREIPDDDHLSELMDANMFVKKLGNRTCCPISSSERSASTTYIKKSGNVWASVYDIENTEKILAWLDGIPLYIGYSSPSVDSIPLETPVLLNHIDDKVQWWSFMSYSSVVLDVPLEDYVIGEAHSFSQDDWIELINKKRPVAIFGRIDLSVNCRGNVFHDVANVRGLREPPRLKPYLCDNYEVLKYQEACSMTEIPTQVYVSTKEDKENCGKFPILRKMKRIMLYNPKRICTEILQDGEGVWVEESDGTEVHCGILNTRSVNANLICPWESRQRVAISVFLITTNTRPSDVYLVRSYTSEKVIFVEKGGGLPSLNYKQVFGHSLINNGI